MNTPKISVIIPSYNHEKYIAQAINSVLMQTFDDYELLIADDFSKDRSRAIIKEYKDPRIRAFFPEVNLGAVGILELLINQSKGEMIALLNSDDYWLQEKLMKQYKIMRENPELGACFTWADVIDEKNPNKDVPYADRLKHINRSQGKWLRHFFFKGNCLCHPSVLINKKIYAELGLYKYYLHQLPDFDMWIRLIKKYPIHILEETLVIHRRHDLNSSAVTNENRIRVKNEGYLIFRTFFDNMDDKVFKEGFEDNFINKTASLQEELLCEQAFLLLHNPIYENVCTSIGLSMFADLLQEKNTREILASKYGFTPNTFYEAMTKR